MHRLQAYQRPQSATCRLSGSFYTGLLQTGCRQSGPCGRMTAAARTQRSRSLRPSVRWTSGAHRTLANRLPTGLRSSGRTGQSQPPSAATGHSRLEADTAVADWAAARKGAACLNAMWLQSEVVNIWPQGRCDGVAVSGGALSAATGGRRVRARHAVPRRNRTEGRVRCATDPA